MKLKKKRAFITLSIVSIILISIIWIKVPGSPPIEEIKKDSKENTDEYPSIEDLVSIPYSVRNTSLIAVGDFLLDRNIGNRMKEINNYHFPIENTKYILESADLTFCNVECPICEGSKVGITQVTFRADPETVEALIYGGFDIVSLANNHTMDFGQNCLIKTFDYINNAKIDYVGAGRNLEEARKPFIKEINDLKIAILAYNDSDVVPSFYFASENSAGTNMMDIDRMKEDINKLKQGEFGNIDLIIISMHSGTEFTPVPNSRQISFAHAAIDAGAEIVLGHHPHAVQHIEQYKGKYIAYSMGNFVLDQMRWDNCTKELLLNISLSKNAVEEVEVIPLRMKKFCETNVAVGTEKDDILEIINFQTELHPYITFKDGSYIQKERDILSNLVTDDDITQELPEENLNSSKKKRWIVEGEQLLEVVKFEKHLYIIQNNEIIWKLRKDWSITDFEIGDFDNDKTDELAIVLWRVGDHGESFDNQETKRGYKYSNHMFIFDFSDGEVKTTWGSSTIESPIIDLDIADIDNDGNSELIALQGTYEDFDTNQLTGKTISIWEWNEEGFSNEFRSKKLEIKSMWISRNMIYLTTSK